MQPITVTAHGAQYELIHFNGPLPQPGPACAEPTPEDRREHDLQNEHICQERRDAQLHEAKEHAGNIIDKISVKCNEVWNAIDKTITSAVDSAENAIHTQCEDNAYGRLRKHFPQFVAEHLLGDFRCKLCTRNGVLPGHLQVTKQHAMFIPDDGTPFAIDVCEILCIQTFKLAEAPTVPPLYHCVNPVPAKEAEGLQLFLTSGQLLIFKEFLDLSLPIRGTGVSVIVEAFTVCDHAWRASGAVVPNPNFQFVEASKFVQPDITVYPIKAATHQEPNTATAVPSRIPTQLEQRSLNALETHS